MLLSQSSSRYHLWSCILDQRFDSLMLKSAMYVTHTLLKAPYNKNVPKWSLLIRWLKWGKKETPTAIWLNWWRGDLSTTFLCLYFPYYFKIHCYDFNQICSFIYMILIKINVLSKTKWFGLIRIIRVIDVKINLQVDAEVVWSKEPATETDRRFEFDPVMFRFPLWWFE